MVGEERSVADLDRGCVAGRRGHRQSAYGADAPGGHQLAVGKMYVHRWAAERMAMGVRHVPANRCRPRGRVSGTETDGRHDQSAPHGFDLLGLSILFSGIQRIATDRRGRLEIDRQEDVADRVWCSRAGAVVDHSGGALRVARQSGRSGTPVPDAARSPHDVRRGAPDLPNAEPAENMQADLNKAQQLVRQGQYREALDQFMGSWATTPQPCDFFGKSTRPIRPWRPTAGSSPERRCLWKSNTTSPKNTSRHR